MSAKLAILLDCSHTFTTSSLANAASLFVLGSCLENHSPILFIKKKKVAKEIKT